MIGIVRPQPRWPDGPSQSSSEFWAVPVAGWNVQPVLDPTAVAPVDGYEVPQRLRAAVRVQQIADVFPFGTCHQPKHGSGSHRTVCVDGLRRAAGPDPARQPRPDRPTRPPGGHPRRLDQNTNPNPATSCTAHRIGYVYLVTNQGTLALGHTTFSNAVWKASKPKPEAIPA